MIREIAEVILVVSLCMGAMGLMTECLILLESWVGP